MRRGFGFRDRHSPFRFHPATMFSAGQQGGVYDPLDRTTVFQDHFGSTAVTSSGQPVGLILDKSQNLALGAELVTDPEFDNSGSWEKSAGVTIAGGEAVWNTAGLSEYVRQSSVTVANTYYEFTIVCSSYTSGSVIVGLGAGASSLPAYAINKVGTVRFRYNVGASFGRVWLLTPSGGAQLSITSFSVKRVLGNHAYQTASGSRPLWRQSGGLSYLEFDGSTDSLTTNAVDLTGIDKMTVWAGMLKSSDAARGMVCEFGDNVAGGFQINAPSASLNDFAFASRGSIFPGFAEATPYTSPISVVATGIGEIGVDTNQIRINGIQAGTNTNDQGTGNYGNHVLYIGRRYDGSLFFNGRLYGLIVLGAQATDWQIWAAEQWMAQRTGISF